MPRGRLLATALNQAFRVFLLAFLAGGLILTSGQVLGVILGRGERLIALTAVLSVPTSMCAAAAGLLAFAAFSVRGQDADDGP